VIRGELAAAAHELVVEARSGLVAHDPAAELLDRASVLLALGRVAGALIDLEAADAALVGDPDRQELVESARNLLGGAR
jgi:hypothetical protein